jgi:hypothetical protein
MTEIQLAHFSFGGDPVESSRFYDVALREARVATDAHASDAERMEVRTRAPRITFAARLRLLGRGRRLALATGGDARLDACACTA